MWQNESEGGGNLDPAMFAAVGTRLAGGTRTRSGVDEVAQRSTTPVNTRRRGSSPGRRVGMQRMRGTRARVVGAMMLVGSAIVATPLGAPTAGATSDWTVWVSLTSDADAQPIAPGVSIVPTKHIPSSAIAPPVDAPDELTIEALSFGDVGDGDLANTLRPSPLRAIPLRAIPLRAIALSSVELRGIPLRAIPVDVPGGWESLLHGTVLAGKPLQSVSLDDALDPALNTNLGTQNGRDLNDVPFGALDLSATPLRAIAIAAVALGATPLRAIPLPGSVPPTGGGDPLLAQWCTVIATGGSSCAELGIDPLAPGSADSVSLVSLSLAGVPLRAIPLRAIPLRAIDLEASPLRAIPLRAIVLASAPLRAIPLRAIPLRAIDLQPSPLRAIPLRAIAGVEGLVDCARVDCSPASAATLGAAADLEPSAIRDTDPGGATVTVGRLVQATQDNVIAGYGLGDLREYGEGTIGDLVDGLPPDAAYTLGDLLMGLIPIEDYPWDSLDLTETAELRTAATADGAGGLAGRLMQYTASFETDTDLPLDIRVDIDLPDGYGYQPLSVQRSGIDPRQPAEPTFVTTPRGRRLRFAIPQVRTGDAVSFSVVPGLDLGPAVTTVEATGVNVPLLALVDSPPVETRVEGEWEEPNDSPASARPLQTDSIYFGHLAAPADVDLYAIQVAEGEALSAILSNLPADFDLTLYAPSPAPLAGRTSDAILVPIQDEPISLESDPVPAPADPADDVALEDLSVAAVGQRRDLGDERIDTGPLAAGTYYLKVTGYNGATSPSPYALRVSTSPGATVPPCTTWSFVGNSAQRGSLPAAGAYVGTNTILLVNRERLFGKFPTAAGSVMTALRNFVSAANANQALGVKAVVLPIDGSAAVHTAYRSWESGTNRCDPLAARAVSSAIATELDSVLATNPQIRNVVIIGGDDIVPFGRVADTTRVANEREFAAELSGNNELTASMRGGWMLTDDVYVDRSPVAVGPAELYVPNVAVGRLVEQPAEIVAALGDFVTFNGHLDAATALSVGYDFLTDGANAVKNGLVANGFTTAANATALIGDTWNAEQLKDALLGRNGFTVADVASINAHFDDHRALPANEDGNPAPTNLVNSGDVITARTLARSLLFSVGCHAGLSVADSTQSTRPDDWSETFARQGAIWLGNTGFGYGDTEVVAASEKLMALFAERLDGTLTVGQALQLAKNDYTGDLGTIVTGYDMKVSQQMTFYGLPMYRLRATAANPPAAPAAPAVQVDPWTGLDSQQITITTPVAAPNDPAPVGKIVQEIGDRGTLYTVDGDVLAVQNRPIQPLVTRDVTRLDAAGQPLGIARGMLVTGLTSVDRVGVNPVVYRPIVDSQAEGEPPTVENVFPAAPVSIGASTDLATVGGAVVPIRRQRVVAVTGQFHSTGGGLGTQRLFTELQGTVLYAPAGNTDTTPPVITLADATISATGATFVVAAQDAAGSVERVHVLAVPTGSGATPANWIGGDLVRTDGGAWTGQVATPPGTTDVDYIVQVVDSSGNVGVSSNKGVLYRTEVPPPPAPDAPQVSFTPTVGASGWLNGPATVTATDPRGLPMSYSLDGGTPQPYTGPFEVTGSGAHLVTVRNTAALAASTRIPIDVTGPAVECAAARSAWSSANVSVTCAAADAGAGLATPADASFVLTTSVPAGTETAAASTGTRQVCDALSRCTTAGPVTGIKVDRKVPTVTLATPVNGATYARNAVVLATYSCNDGGSGVVSCTGTRANGVAIDTATVGAKSFAVTAVDAAGNTTTTSVTYSVTGTNAAPVVVADMGVSGLQSIGYQSNAVLLAGSFTDADGAGPYTASVRWAAGGQFTRFVLTGSNRFVGAFVYPSAGTRTVTVRICDAAGACGTDDVTVVSGVTSRVTPTRCVVDRGTAANPRYLARFGYRNAATVPLFIPTVNTLENYVSPNPANRGQPQVFLAGTQANAFSVGFQSGTTTWRLNGTTTSASSSSPRC